MVFAGAAVAQIADEPTRPESHEQPREAPAAIPVCRRILALASRLSSDRGSTQDDAIRDMLELPLEHLGMSVEPIDATSERAPEVDWTGVSAVMTAFHYGDECAPWVWDVLEHARSRGGIRFLHVGEFGPLSNDRARLGAWLAAFGLEDRDGWVGDPVQIEVLPVEGCETAYEGRQSFRIAHFGPRSNVETNRVWLCTKDRRSRDERAPIVTGPWGGLALLPWAFTPGGVHADRRWHVDPFAFFIEALGIGGVPCADPNVFCGRRAFFFHVDGDGFESVSTVRSRGSAGAICGEVFRDEILERYDLPMSLSIIVASLTEELEPEAPTHAMEVARQLFASDKVEIASHSMLHPLDWRRRWSPAMPPRVVNWYDGIRGYRHDMVAEVRESVRFVDRYLVPPGKHCALMFWSGAANPDEASLAAADELGVLNINGGVARWDDLNDSVGFVNPRGRAVGDRFQVYCGAPNENVFDGFFSSMPGAFAHVDRTIDNCGKRRILKPANVYAHFYSVERPARLRALQGLLDRWGRTADTAPVLTSDYVRAVLAVRNRCKVLRITGGWQFEGFDACRTVRIEGDDRAIDWHQSPGVVGERRIGLARYVTLGASEATIVFAVSEENSSQPAPHLIEANHILDEFVRTNVSLGFRSTSIAKRVCVCGGFEPTSPVRVILDGNSETRRADGEGRVTIELPAGGSTRIEVAIE